MPVASVTSAVPSQMMHVPPSQQPDAKPPKGAADSLYGPGTVGCWLLVVCSVLLSWTLNPQYRRKDYITNDYIAALLFPCVASVHLAVLLYRLPAPLVEVIASPDPEMLQRIAAIDAPLEFCEISTVFLLPLFAMAAWNKQIK